MAEQKSKLKGAVKLSDEFSRKDRYQKGTISQSRVASGCSPLIDDFWQLPRFLGWIFS